MFFYIFCEEFWFFERELDSFCNGIFNVFEVINIVLCYIGNFGCVNGVGKVFVSSFDGEVKVGFGEIVGERIIGDLDVMYG